MKKTTLIMKGLVLSFGLISLSLLTEVKAMEQAPAAPIVEQSPLTVLSTNHRSYEFVQALQSRTPTVRGGTKRQDYDEAAHLGFKQGHIFPLYWALRQNAGLIDFAAKNVGSDAGSFQAIDSNDRHEFLTTFVTLLQRIGLDAVAYYRLTNNEALARGVYMALKAEILAYVGNAINFVLKEGVEYSGVSASAHEWFLSMGTVTFPTLAWVEKLTKSYAISGGYLYVLPIDPARAEYFNRLVDLQKAANHDAYVLIKQSFDTLGNWETLLRSTTELDAAFADAAAKVTVIKETVRVVEIPAAPVQPAPTDSAVEQLTTDVADLALAAAGGEGQAAAPGADAPHDEPTVADTEYGKEHGDDANFNPPVNPGEGE